MSAPATWGWKRRVADVLARANVLAPTVSLYQTMLGIRGAVASRGRPTVDGLDVPPARVRVRVGPSFGDLETFLESGARHAALVRHLVEREGITLESTAPILDFGCGAGRVARHWQGVDVELHGCDVNDRMVAWCREHLPFGRFEVNQLTPPLPYGDDSFGLAYAFSVFTHLPEPLQHAWITEMRRVLRPDGLLLFSTLGEHYVGLDRLNPEERRRFDDGNLVVLFEEHAGENVCSAYHPQPYVQHTLAAGFDYVAHERGGEGEEHDMHLLRRPETT